MLRVIGPDLVTATPWDIGLLVDGSWRFAHGQIAHRDYSSPIGPVVFALLHLGTLVKGDTIAGLSTAVALYSTLWLLFWAGAARLFPAKGLYGAMMALSFSFMITPRVMGYYATSIGYTGLYNSIGYGLLTYLFCDAVQDKSAVRQMFWRGCIFGIIGVLCAFTKITLGVAAFAIFLYVALVRRHGLTWLYGTSTGGICALIAFAAVYDWSFSKVISDLLLAASIKSEQLFQVDQFALTPILALSGIWTAIFVFWAWRQGTGALYACIAFSGIGVFVAYSIGQIAEIATLAALSAFLASIAWKPKIPRLLIAGLLLPLILTIGQNVAAVFISPAAMAISPFSPFAAEYISRKTLLPRIVGYAGTGQVTEHIKGRAGPDVKIAVMSTNFVSALANVPPPDGGRLYWHEGVTFSHRVLDDPKLITQNVGDARLILIPTDYAWVTQNFVEAVERAFSHCRGEWAGSWRVLDCPKHNRIQIIR